MSRYEVVRDATDTSRTVWRFRLVGWRHDDSRVVLDYYARETRATRRHKWVAEIADRYVADEPRRYHSGIDVQDVPLDDDDVEDVRRAIALDVASIPVVRAAR